VPDLKLELLDSTGVQVRGEGATGGAGGMCPSIVSSAPFASDLAAGTYFLRATTTEEGALFSYRMQIRVN
jgi:hypothetical protein